MATYLGSEDTEVQGRAPTTIDGIMFTPADHNYLDLTQRPSLYENGITDLQGGDLIFGGPDFVGQASINNPNFGKGQDLLQGYGGSDIIYGGAGNDFLFGDSRQAAPNLIGLDSGDDLFGGDGNDWLSGGLGDDTLDGGFGFDTLNGGEGFDTADYTFFNGRTSINLAMQRADFPDNNPQGLTEWLFGIDEVRTGGGNDELRGDDRANFFFAGAGNDSLDGESGGDFLAGEGGIDTVVLGGLRSAYSFLGSASSFGATISGETDNITGVEFVRFGNGETVSTAALFDTQRPSVSVAIADALLNDADRVSQVTFAFSEAIAAGSFGASDVSVTNGVLSNLVVAANSLSATAEFRANDGVSGSGSVAIAAGTFTDAAGNPNTASDIDTVAINTRVNVRIEGGPGHDTLGGTPKSDIIDGKRGNDTLLGSVGADQMIGGPGRDTVKFTRAVTLDLQNDERNTGQADGDAFSSIERFQLSGGNDRAFGDNRSNYFSGGNGTDLLHGRGGNDFLNGDNGNDKLFGNNGNDTIFGGNGSDLIVGGLGRDRINGNAGADRYDFNAIQETVPGSQRDIVYVSTGDRIDLRTIDAEQGTGGNQAFRWVNRKDLDAAFTGEEGQLRFSSGVLRGDTDGDKLADFEVRVLGSLSWADIIL